MAQPKKRRTQAERTEASDKAMYKAAIKLIAKEGPEKMTLAKIGKVAGFSGGLVSYRFGSKQKLLEETAQRILDLWRERVLLPSLEEAQGIDFLELTSRRYLQAVEAKSDLMLAQFRLMNESYSTCKELRPFFSDYDKEVRQGIVDILKPLQKTREIDPKVNLDDFAVVYMSMLRGVAVQYFVDAEAVDLEKAYKMIELTCERVLMNK
jgi:AcrR family transcriptional regulator